MRYLPIAFLSRLGIGIWSREATRKQREGKANRKQGTVQLVEFQHRKIFEGIMFCVDKPN
jgi:hypothetical protein